MDSIPLWFIVWGVPGRVPQRNLYVFNLFPVLSVGFILLKIHGSIKSIVAVSSNRGKHQIVFPCERACVDVGTSHTNGSSCGYVPPVVFLTVYAAPADIRRKQVGRCAPFPAVTTLNE